MDGSYCLFFGDNELKTYQDAKKNNELEGNYVFRNLSSEIIKGLDIYLNNYQDYVLKYKVIDSIKNDLINMKHKMNLIETKEFLKEAYYNRTGISNVNELFIFGTSIYNPMLNNSFLEASLFIKFQENNIYQNTGISFEVFKAYTKDEQNLILGTMKNILINKTNTVSDALDELQGQGEI